MPTQKAVFPNYRLQDCWELSKAAASLCGPDCRTMYPAVSASLYAATTGGTLPATPRTAGHYRKHPPTHTHSLQSAQTVTTESTHPPTHTPYSPHKRLLQKAPTHPHTNTLLTVRTTGYYRKHPPTHTQTHSLQSAQPVTTESTHPHTHKHTPYSPHNRSLQKTHTYPPTHSPCNIVGAVFTGFWKQMMLQCVIICMCYHAVWLHTLSV